MKNRRTNGISLDSRWIRAIGLLFTAFLALHAPTGIALANPGPPPDPTDWMRMDLSPRLLVLAVPLGIIIELFVAGILIGRFPGGELVSKKRLVYVVGLTNLASIPALWLFLGSVLQVPGAQSAVPILLGECAVTVMEGCIYRLAFPVSLRDGLKLSLCANLASYFGGLMFFGYIDPSPPDIFGF
jgi:hypothetical protein